MKQNTTEIVNCKLSNTEEQIILILKKNNAMSLNAITNSLDILTPTISNGIKSLLSKKIIFFLNNNYILTNKGINIINYLNFKKTTIVKFSIQNNITVENLLKNKSDYPLNLIVAFYNLLKKSH